MGPPPQSSSPSPFHHYALLTGANSGLGLSLCTRFLHEFLLTRPSHHHITLIFTTRTPSKSASTASHILAFLSRHASEYQHTYHTRVTLRPAFVDLTKLTSVLSLADELLGKIPPRAADNAGIAGGLGGVERLDWVFLNAGLLSVVSERYGIRWGQAIKDVLTRPVAAVTTPEYKIQKARQIALQLPPSREGKIITLPPTSDSPEATSPDDGLGLTFSANVFGHYFLLHRLLPLLVRPANSPHPRARVIWSSSLEAHPTSLSPQDLQCLHGTFPYESSKRLTDILALAYESLPETSDVIHTSFLSSIERDEQGKVDGMQGSSTKPPRFLLSHPAICATGISNLPPLLWYLMALIFYIARIFFNSPWHPVSAWKGNCAMIFLALEASEEELDACRGRVKWGSACSRWGEEYVRRTEVVGLKESGSGRVRVGKSEGKGEDVGEVGEVEVTQEMRSLGRECWLEMERLRKTWLEKLVRK